VESELELVQKDFIAEQTAKESIEEELLIMNINYEHCKSELRTVLNDTK
jgi:hypothetical protein